MPSMLQRRETLKTYEYQPLPPNHIRIINLQPGDFNDSVVVEISSERPEGLSNGGNADDDERSDGYNALSWQWGPEAATKQIRIKNIGDDMHRTMPVRPNLLAALKRLRRPGRVVRLWVDAICIDQIELGDGSDEAKKKNLEKSKQISMMTEIFGGADEVSVWLGEPKDEEEKTETALAVGFIEKLVNLDDTDHIAGLDRKADVWGDAPQLGPFVRLLKRGWFSRRWVVQEISVAQTATVYCGDQTVSWTKLATAVALLEKVAQDGTINRMMKTLRETNHASEYIGSFSSLPAYRLVQNTSGVIRDDDKGVKLWRYTLEELVSFLAAFKASRLHDTIYAVLGIASDVRPVHAWDPTGGANNPTDRVEMLRRSTKFDWGRARDPFPVDYNKEPLLVFKEFLNFSINKSKSLDILCRPWAPDKGLDIKGNPYPIELPSWIPSLSRKPFQPTRDNIMVRFNPDPLVGPATHRHRFYSASGEPEEVVFLVDLKDPHSRSITVSGFVLDKVSQIWSSGEFGNVPGSWLDAANWMDVNKEPPSELWRTLVADRTAAGHDTDRWYPLVFQSVAKDRGLSYGFETQRLIHETTNATVSEVFRRVQAVVWGRRLIRTSGMYMDWRMGETGPHSGALGLAPSNTQEGDLVCIIFGCSVPLILREVRQPDQSSVPNGRPVSPIPSDTASEAYTTGSEPRKFPLRPPSSGAEADTTALSGGLLPDVANGSASSASKGKATAHMPQYTLLGECYIHNMMDGQAITYWKEKKGKETMKFVIV